MLKRVAICALLSVSLASAKSYTITLSDSCRAGTAQLEKGQYTLKLEGDKVVLVDKSGRTVQPPAKVETTDRKFAQTAVAISRVEGENRLQWIALGGSRSRVVFE